MKLKIKITEDILKQSAYCGFNPDGTKLMGESGVVSLSGGVVSLSEGYTENCAIALATRAILGDVDICSMGGTIAIFNPEAWEDHGKSIASLPQKAHTFLSKFDRMNPNERLANLKPIEFTISVNKWFIDEISLDDLETCPTMELVEA